MFLVAYGAKSQADSREKNGQIISEKMIALTTQQLADATNQFQNKKFSTKQILENFVEPLVNQGPYEQR